MSAVPIVPAQNAGTRVYPPPGTKVHFRPYGAHKRPNLGIRNDIVCAIGEFLGTGMFLFFALGATNFVVFANASIAFTTFYIAIAQGISVMSVAVLHVRISGSLFNPAISFSLFLIGTLHFRRMIFEFVAQFAGAIAGVYVLAAVTPFPMNVAATLASGTSIAQGFFLELLLTAMLAFSVLMLPTLNVVTTVTGPIIVGLTLIAIKLLGTGLSGAGVNPAAVLAAAIVSNKWRSYDWIYYIAPFVGSVLAAVVYSFILFVEYDTQRGMMRWCEDDEDEVEVESGRSVRSQELVIRGSEERVLGERSIAKEAEHETVSHL